MELQPLLIKYKRYIVIFGIGIGLIVVGLIIIFISTNTSNGVEIVENDTPVATSGGEISTGSNTIVVEVSGAVQKPGVYHFSSGSRVDEALQAAGGITKDANSDFVAKSINRAGKLTDGQKIYIPEKSETAVLGETTSTTGLINVNTATQSQLEHLPGVGPATATKIISNRPYGNLDELVDKKAVSAKVFEQIKEKISLY